MSIVLKVWLICLCAAILGWGFSVLVEAVVDGHRRGMARVHRGRSWDRR